MEHLSKCRNIYKHILFSDCMEKRSVYLIVSIVALAVSIIGVVTSPSFTGLATESYTSSSVTVQKYLAISMSANLVDGINYGTVSSLPSIDTDSTDNYNGASSTTTMYINVSSDSNTAVDFCIKGNSGLNDPVGRNTIGLGNETYLNSTSTSSTVPGPSTSSLALTTSYVKSGAAIAIGTADFYRFWLDVPTATASGTYNNSIYFKGVENTQAC